MDKMKFNRKEVIALLDELLERPDLLIEAVTNENTLLDAEELLIIAEKALETLKA